jgi:hypothetical protein
MHACVLFVYSSPARCASIDTQVHWNVWQMVSVFAGHQWFQRWMDRWASRSHSCISLCIHVPQNCLYILVVHVLLTLAVLSVGFPSSRRHVHRQHTHLLQPVWVTVPPMTLGVVWFTQSVLMLAIDDLDGDGNSWAGGTAND